MNKKYYKIVVKHEKRNKHLYSLNWLNCWGSASTFRDHIIRYTVGRWAVPKITNSGIFVFDTLIAAKRMIEKDRQCGSGRGIYYIYECEVTRPRKIHQRALSSCFFNEFWLGYPVDDCFLVDETHTICDSCKLTNLVYAEKKTK